MDDNLQQHNESNTQYSFTGPTILPEENRHDRHPPSENPTLHSNHVVPRICHASKCRLLLAKGILRRPMLCASNKSMCSGCINESLRHQKMQQIEHEILIDSTPNDTLAPILNGFIWLQVLRIYVNLCSIFPPVLRNLEMIIFMVLHDICRIPCRS
jgi:hypothetical protein